MKIMFISDIHGDTESLKKVKTIYDEESIDKIIILGDVYYGHLHDYEEFDKTLSSFKDPIITKGNCDSEIDCMSSVAPFFDSIYDEFFGKKFFCSHGNRYNIDRFPDKEFDVMVYGHTHVGMIVKKGNKYFLNPGSISYPRGLSERSFMIIDESGIYLKNLENNVIDKLNW